MSEKLGIAVTTGNHMSHLLGLAKAAKKAGKQTQIFFTGQGVCLTQDVRFRELHEVARVAVCERSFITNGYIDKKISGMLDKDFVTQGRNAEMMEDCDRYLIF